jgi:hypothetical protein
MAINYCVNCGQKLHEGARFCSSCGTSVPSADLSPDESATDGPPFAPQPAADAEATALIVPAAKPGVMPSERTAIMEPVGSDMRGFDILSTHHPADNSEEPARRGVGEAPRESTAVIDPIVPEDVPTSFEAPDRRGKPSAGAMAGRMIALIALALLIVASGVFLAVFHPWTGEGAQTQAAASLASAGAQVGNAASTAIEKAEVATAREASFQGLLTAYNALSAYDQRIAACVQTYNGARLSNDTSTRTTAADTCRALQSDIQADIDTVDTLDIDQASPYFTDYQNVHRLQTDELQRIAVLVKSWDVSLQYDDPAQYVGAIDEPILKDNDSSGTNKYKQDFESTYGQSKPTR